jgi:hypothetical protein
MAKKHSTTKTAAVSEASPVRKAAMRAFVVRETLRAMQRANSGTLDESKGYRICTFDQLRRIAACLDVPYLILATALTDAVQLDDIEKVLGAPSTCEPTEPIRQPEEGERLAAMCETLLAYASEVDDWYDRNIFCGDERRLADLLRIPLLVVDLFTNRLRAADIDCFVAWRDTYPKAVCMMIPEEEA